MVKQNPNNKKPNILNSKKIYDLSKNILKFNKIKTFHEWNGRINDNKKDINKKPITLHMKVEKILKGISDKRKTNNKKYINICSNLDNHENRIIPTSTNTIDQLLEKINKKYEKMNNNLYSFSSSSSISSTYTPGYYNTFNIPPPVPPRPLLKMPLPPKRSIKISVEINNIKDLLELCEKYPLKDDIEYNIDMKTIHKIQKPLAELDNMIGMTKLKESVVDQIIFFIQKLHLNNNTKESDFMHTVIYGPPGTGKTEIAKIMGRIFSKLNVLSTGKFKKVTRADLIAGYLGQTAIKTKEVMERSLGGVLFIDEAYALGNKEKRDSFSKECIDTLCEGLSDHKNNLMVIIAGYEKELKECFFNYNGGLDSRFTWRFHIDNYTPDELKLIFEKKVKDASWKLQKNIKTRWFEKNMEYFKYYGRDMETLFAKTKIAHAKRVFCMKKDEKTIISKKDLERGLRMFLDNDEVKKRKEKSSYPDLYL